MISFNIFYWYDTEMKKTKLFFKPDFLKEFASINFNIFY